MNDSLMVIMASGIACGCIRMTMTSAVMESRNMVATLQKRGWQRPKAGLEIVTDTGAFATKIVAFATKISQ